MASQLNIIYNISDLNEPTGESFVEHFEKKAKKLLRFLKDIEDEHSLTARVIVEGNDFEVKIELKGSKYNLFSSEKHHDFRAAINKAIDEIVGMIKKSKND